MSSLDAGREIAGKLNDDSAGILATVDPRSATPPCLLIGPPLITFDLGCGMTARWAVIALAPATGNPDAWEILDGLLAHVAGHYPVERSEFVAYTLSPDNPPHPAYRIEFTEGIDL